MKSTLLLLVLVAAPLALSQTRARAQTAPVRPVLAPQAPLPDAQQLLDELFAPYIAAKTFRGSFDFSIKDDSAKVKISELHLKTRYRFNNKGDLQSEDTTVVFAGLDSEQKSELRLIQDSGTDVRVAPEEKIWWRKGGNELGSQPTLISILRPFFDTVGQAFKEFEVTPVVSRSVEAGRPVFVLNIEGTNSFRIVVDQQTRALALLRAEGRFFRCAPTINRSTSR